MRSWKSVSLTIAGIALGLVVVAVVLGIVLRNFLVNLWWFDSLDYGYYFWLQVLYHYGVYAAGVVVLFVLFFANFWIGGRYLGASPPGDEPRSGQSPPRRIYRRFQRRSLALYLRPQGVGVTCLCPSGVVTNIVEQIRVVGEARTPVAPPHPVVEAEVVGELVADAVEHGTFLVVTAQEAIAESAELAADTDGYLDRHVATD